MLDHIGLRTTQLDTLTRFYEAALAPVGYTKMVDYGEAIGFGQGFPDLWLGTGTGPANIHLALRVDSRDKVDAFYQAAMAAGAKDNGPPGPRPEYTPTYYGAFVLDPDGNNLEVVCHQG